MSEGNTAKKEVAETEGTEPKVKINRDRYTTTKTASGAKSLNNGDEVATVLDGLHVDELFTIGKEILGEDFAEKYAKLNVGMQRMNMGNRLRAKVRSIDADKKNEGKEGVGLAALTKAAKPFAKERDARVKAAEKEKAAKQKEREAKAAEAAKKKTEKAEAKAKKEKDANKATTAK